MVVVATDTEYEVRDVRVEDGLHLALRPLGATPAARPVLRGRPGPGGAPPDLALVPDGTNDDGEQRWRLDGPLLGLPLGRWSLVLHPVRPDDAAGPRVRVAPGVLAVLPVRQVEPCCRTVVERTREGLDVVREPDPWAPMS